MAPRRSVSIEREIEALLDLPRGCLLRRWRELYGTNPPGNTSRDLLIRAIAHRLQERALGGLKPATQRRLARAAGDLAAGRAPSIAPLTIKPGTRLLREWHGVTHEVIVLEDGVRYRGKVWRSLSAVAREITGARWSGPLFFGLRGRSHDGR